MKIIKFLNCTLHAEGISHGCLSDPSRRAASLYHPISKYTKYVLGVTSRASQEEGALALHESSFQQEMSSAMILSFKGPREI